MSSIFRPTEAQWAGTIKAIRRFADAVAVVLSMIGIHFLSDEVTWRQVWGIAFLMLSMVVIKWRCEQ
jgi:multidrug transporter EmrE-like cation transporter